MGHAHDNEIFFYSGDSDVTSISFGYGNEYDVTEGEPFKSVKMKGNGTDRLTITARAGRKKSYLPARWWCDQVNNDGTKMIHTANRDYRPDELNFAFKGTLTINGANFDIGLGQGNYMSKNNWFLNSDSLVAANNNKSGTVTNGSNAYKISQHATNSFLVKKA